jgi:hypothetical protein
MQPFSFRGTEPTLCTCVVLRRHPGLAICNDGVSVPAICNGFRLEWPTVRDCEASTRVGKLAHLPFLCFCYKPVTGPQVPSSLTRTSRLEEGRR